MKVIKPLIHSIGERYSTRQGVLFFRTIELKATEECWLLVLLTTKKDFCSLAIYRKEFYNNISSARSLNVLCFADGFKE